MLRRLLSLFMVWPIFGCSQDTGTQAAKPSDADQGRRFQFHLGASGDDPLNHLPFKIVSVYRNQVPSDEAPFHADGGNWIFFDCEADGNVSFLVGTVTKTTDEGTPSQWGRALLAVRDNEAGRQFVEKFAKCFGATIPESSRLLQSPKPLFVNTAVLGGNLNREAGGGFAGEGGGWTATKWFLSDVGTEAEVYFNFNLDERQGEFSEKDADYADDMVAILALALRDGPRPERTPDNDPNLTLIGPSIGPARKLLSRRTSLSTFTSDSRYAVFQDKTKTMALPVKTPSADPIEIAQFENSPWQVHLLNDDMDLLVQEGIPEQPGVKSSADPMRIWWVDHATKKLTLLRGPEIEINLTESPLSPDHRFVALDQFQTDPGNRNRFKVIHLIDRVAGSSVLVKTPKNDLSLIGWKQTEAGLRAVALTNRWGFDKEQPSQTYWIDPATGNLELQQDSGVQIAPDLVSPDRKFRVQIGNDDLTITNLESGEDGHFVFHEEDGQFVGEGCVDWVSPRYLQFYGPRLALIDAKDLKMCFPRSADENHFPSAAYNFSPDFRWVLYQGEGADGEGLFLAPVESPK